MLAFLAMVGRSLAMAGRSLAMAGKVQGYLSFVDLARRFTRHGHRDPVRDGGMLEMYQLTACG